MYLPVLAFDTDLLRESCTLGFDLLTLLLMFLLTFLLPAAFVPAIDHLGPGTDRFVNSRGPRSESR